MLKNLDTNLKNSLPGILLISVIFFLSTGVSLALNIPLAEITESFSYSVLVIMIVMEMFTNLVAETGVMQLLATKIAVISKGNKKICLALFGMLMYFISAFLNNITAVMIILPVIFVLLKALNADRKYICLFFSVILALSNTGGASSPIGDFPAILIMSSGITSFSQYLLKAFPLFLVTSIVIVCIWVCTVKDECDSKSMKLLAVDLLQSRYRNIQVRYDVLIPLMGVMLCMFIVWSFVPQKILPPGVVAILGYCASLLICSIKGVRICQAIDMKSVLTIASFLFMATVVSASGVLVELAEMLQETIPNPKVLLIVIMIITSVVSGLVSAGPASAAMLPVIIDLCNTTFASQSDWIAIAYAASICAGSSLFLWSATAGFILSGKVDVAKLEDKGEHIMWGIKEYFSKGIVNYFVQITIAMVWILIVI